MSSSARRQVPAWVQALFPLAIIGAVVGIFLWRDPIAGFRSVPPAEALAVERTTFTENGIQLKVRNDGPDPVTIAQVLVNEAYWQFEIGQSTLGRLEATEVSIEYPWDAGLPVEIVFVTSTGLTIAHDVEAAALTPQADASTFMIYGLLGVYIGILPVAIGLLWFPALSRASPRIVGFFLAFTAGLLAFLLVDTVAEARELAEEAGGSLNALGLFVTGALVALLGLFALGTEIERRSGAGVPPLALAYLVAAGIGLHNLGEGLAVGAALAAGEVALGTFLVIGFALHNTTEGLAIVAPLGNLERRPPLRQFAALGAVAGAPTVAGAWLGGFAFAPAWAALAFGIAAGAIAQVVWTLARGIRDEAAMTSPLGAAGFALGLGAMYLTGLLTV